MPLLRKFPEIRKFQIERKNFKNETVSLDKNNGSKKRGGGKVGKKEYQNSLIKIQNGDVFHTSVFSQIF